MAGIIETSPHLSLHAPRPYPWFTRQGWRWVKSSPYWAAYVGDGTQTTITAIVHESADIPNRL
jgi:hypothetical protein